MLAASMLVVSLNDIRILVSQLQDRPQGLSDETQITDFAAF
jgi:hypothetical protein